MKTKNPLRILIVDDDPLQSWFWQQTLEARYGNKVKVAAYNDSREALKQVDSSISLVLLDWHMPGLNGKGFLAAARQKGVDPKKVVIVSGSAIETLHEKFQMGECLAVIEKGAPDQEAVLLKILDEAVKGTL